MIKKASRFSVVFSQNKLLYICLKSLTSPPMKKFLKIFSLALFVIHPLCMHAQFGMGKIDEIESVQKRKLIVVLEEPRERILKRLTKKKKEDQVESYKTALNEYNAIMKEVIEKYWPYKANGIEYKSYKEVLALKKADNKDYAVVYCISQHPSSFNAGFVNSDGLNWSWDMKDDSEDRDYLDYFTTMVVNVIEDFERKPVYSTPLPDVFPSKASIVFGVSTCQYYFDYRIRTKKNGEKVDAQKMQEEQIKENAPKLKDMTLLIRQDWLNKDLPEASIKTHYPYKYKVVSSEEMDKAVVGQQEKTAYILILPYVISTSKTNSIMFFHYIYDAKSCALMAFVQPKMGAMMAAGNFGGKAGKRTIEKTNLEKFTEQVNGKK